MEKTTLTEFGRQIREAETTLARLVDIAKHAKFTDLVAGEKHATMLTEVWRHLGDAGEELLGAQEIMRQLLRQ